ncbi:integral membrane protein S linking to the trans Golgi network-domain-containing protein, partial [Cyathus striatus]
PAQKPKTTLTTWDPILLIAQIVAMQALHYIVMSVLVPPLLAAFAEPDGLAYEGGAANVGMIMDWRLLAGIPTIPNPQLLATWWSGGKKLGTGSTDPSSPFSYIPWIDPMRGWVIALCWLGACTADIYFLYTFVRRPRLILDFTLTLLFNHLVLTTYYSASIPTSGFFWLVLLLGAAMTLIGAEQACVRREMKDGLKVAYSTNEEERGLTEEME